MEAKSKTDSTTKTVVPNAASNVGKKEQVAEMFDNIAHRYDFLNHFLSLNIDKVWRRKTIKMLAATNPATILDIATGTADLAIAAQAAMPSASIIGVDISAGMLAVGQQKLEAKQLTKSISLQLADSESLPFEDDSFDAVMCAYGVRNFENLEIGLREMRRVLKPGGQVAILEFSHPQSFPVKQLYGFYSRYLLPLFGKLVSKDSRAYSYLPESVAAFPQGNDFTKIMERCGFGGAVAKPMTFGITTLYVGGLQG